MSTEIIITTKEELAETIKRTIQPFFAQDEKRQKLYSINQVAKKLGRSFNTIKKLVEQGKIQSTPDKRIPEKSLNEYLGKKQK